MKNILVSKSRNYRILFIILIFQLAPVLRYIDSLKYAIRSIKAERRGDFPTQRKYYEMMLKEDSDVALLRVLECFLEAAPQQILQITILLVSYGRGIDNTLTCTSYIVTKHNNIYVQCCIIYSFTSDSVNY